jgi:biotin carboxyl carrier protein
VSDKQFERVAADEAAAKAALDAGAATTEPVSPIAPEVPGPVTSIAVHENQVVRIGDALFVIEYAKVAEDVRTYGAGMALHLPNGVIKRLAPNDVIVRAEKPDDDG